MTQWKMELEARMLKSSNMYINKQIEERNRIIIRYW